MPCDDTHRDAENDKKLTLMTSAFLTVSVAMFGIIALLLAFKLNYGSAHVFSELFDAMSWWN